MKTVFTIMLISMVIVNSSSCQESGARALKPKAEKGMVHGKAVDAKGNPLKNVQIELYHTVWSDKKLSAVTDEHGLYSVTLPAEPRGNWTIQAKHTSTAFGQPYQFVLDANDNSSFGGARGAIRNFTWKLVGEHIGGQYGGEVDVYSTVPSLPLGEVKLIFTPTSEFLVDGTEAKTIEKKLEQVNGTYRAAFIPLGKYAVQAVYKGKILNLSDVKNGKSSDTAIDLLFKPTTAVSQAAFKAELFVQD